jgi:hypothetical protein
VGAACEERTEPFKLEDVSSSDALSTVSDTSSK